MVQSILVTGANKGLGFESVKQLSKAFPNATIFLGARSVSRGQEAVNKLHAENLGQHVQVLELDVSNPESIARAFENVRSIINTLDVLVNNAGITENESTSAGVFAVNLFGVKQMVDTFTPILASNGLIINVSSEVGTWSQHNMSPELQSTLSDIDNLSWNKLVEFAQDYQQPTKKYGWPSPEKTFGTYGISKTLLTAYTRLLAAEKRDLHVVAVCPGYCATDLNQNSGFRSVVVGGSSIIWPILNPGFTEGLLYQDGEAMPFSGPMPAHFH
ncbi:hypothetical protein HK100_002876 [Physocladia obscura]|uniref:NAD(P)-binding protein n=1 Tax=Physocladia obscura TaxID=109957 RepID=A0AAD5SUU0_9FUNG|nr:hypothetical protein HK100_002876 [Physocladia obscura]